MGTPIKIRYPWLALLLLMTGLGCNPGQCLRQSDCPLGSTCKQGVCRTPPKSTSDESDQSSSVPDATTSAVSSDGLTPASTSDTASGAHDGGASAVSGQSSNVDAASDTSTTLAP
jgi:hypothetical protein